MPKILEGLHFWKYENDMFTSPAGTIIQKDGSWVFVPNEIMSSTSMPISMVGELALLLKQATLLVVRLEGGDYAHP